jgi:pimeloyl-ACP methyl ester carboxylesterase
VKIYDTGTCRLAYECLGAGDGFPLLFLHGATVDHVSMKNTFEEYFGGRDGEYRRVYVDLPGHGASGYSFFRANMGDMLAETLAFLRGNFGRPPCVVGYSMGGFMALKLAETIPFPALFLVAPPVYTDSSRIKKPPAMGLALDELTGEERKAADRRYLLLAAKRTPDSLRRYRANLSQGLSPGQYLYQAALFRNAAAEDLSIVPEKIVSRAAFVVGQQDLLVGYSDQFELFSKMKFSEYHSFYDCGHFLPVECPQFGGIFRDWLESASPRNCARAAICAAEEPWALPD